MIRSTKEYKSNRNVVQNIEIQSKYSTDTIMNLIEIQHKNKRFLIELQYKYNTNSIEIQYKYDTNSICRYAVEKQGS